MIRIIFHDIGENNQRGFGFGTPTIALGSWNGGSSNNLTNSTDQFIGFDPNTPYIDYIPSFNRFIEPNSVDVDVYGNTDGALI